MIIDFSWFNGKGVSEVINAIYKIVDIIRIVVPIGLIVMTTFDVSKKVINPEDKEGQKKILIRAIAALVIFLLPTIINLFLRLTGIKGENIDVTPGTEVVIDPNTTLDSLEITNCPSVSKAFSKGNLITLNTNIPINFSGDIKWTINRGNGSVKLKEFNNRRSTELDILTVSNDETISVVVEAAGKSNYCTINLEKERLSSVGIYNCPSSGKKYKIGDTIDFKSNIVSSFTGDIEWRVSNTSSATIVGSKNKKDATVKVLSRSSKGEFLVVLEAGGTSSSCLVQVEAVDKLEITNCPKSSTVLHVGDKVTLKTNLPDNYNDDIKWSNTYPGIFRLTPSSDSKTATVEVIGIPATNNAYISLDADSKTTTCAFNIQSDAPITPTPTPTETFTPTPTPTPTPPAKCDPPTNVTISNNSISPGKVRWTESSNAIGYEISMNMTNWISAYSGYDFKQFITESSGLRTVYVRSVCSSGVSNNVASASINVYSIEVKKGTGVDFVNGGGNYIEGSTVTISATTSNNYDWDYWLSNVNGKITKKNYSFTVNSNEIFTAYAKK